MTQHYTLNVKLSNSQLNELKSGIKNGTQVTLNLSWNVIGDSNDETNFLHNLLSTDTQVSRLHKAFVNGSSAGIKSSKTQLPKMLQLGGFLDRLLGPLLKTGLPLMKSVLTLLAKSFQFP